MTTKTDRELLELAARAVGLSLRWVGDASTVPYSPEESAERGGVDGYMWNPLTDDGDALRLAVKLTLDLQIAEDGVDVIAVVPRARYAPREFVGDNSDACAATRRAIVRAAAAIGETL